MANFQHRSPFTYLLLFFALITIYSSILIRANLIDDSKSFQSENEILEPKSGSYSGSSTTSIGTRQDGLDGLTSGSDLTDPAAESRTLIKLMSLLEPRKKLPANWILRQALLSGQHKRQIRYQQCYFNPISCF